MNDDTAPPTAGPGRRREGRFWVAALHTWALFAFAVAQPLYDLLGRNAAFFVAHDSETVDILAVVAVLALGAPGLIVLAELAVWRWAPAAFPAAHAAVVGALAGLLVLPVVDRLGLPGWVLPAAVAGSIGAAAGLAYHRWDGLRSFLTWTSPAPVLFALLFLLASPVSRLVFGDEAVALAGPVVGDVPIVVVVFDEMSTASLLDAEGRIDASLFPNFAALAKQGTWYRRATAVAEGTVNALPSIVTGRYPDVDLLPVSRDHPRNLFTLLGDSYELEVVEQVTALCPEAVCEGDAAVVAAAATDPGLGDRLRLLGEDLGYVYLHLVLPDELTSRLPAIDNTWADFRAASAGVEPGAVALASEATTDVDTQAAIRASLRGDRAREVEEFVAAVAEGGERRLWFLHAALPHAPYRYLPSGRQYGNAGGIDGLDEELWADDPSLVGRGYQRYLLQAAFVDALLGDLVAAMQQAGIYDEAALVVTADQGVAFVPGDFRRAVTEANKGELMGVPLLIKAPHQETGGTSDANAEAIDILPTVADAIGVELPWEVDGRSLLAAGDDAPTGRGDKLMYTNDGEIVTAPPGFPELDEAMERKLGMVEPGTGVSGVYRIGPAPSLVGRPVTELTVAAEPAGTAELFGGELLADVRPGDVLTPTHVLGRIGTPRLPRPDLAVAVNGVIQAVTRSFDYDGGEGRFAALVPEEAFRAGANDVRVYVVVAAEPARLAPLAQRTALPYRLEGSALIAGDVVVPIVTSGAEGSVDEVREDDTGYRFAGWAGDASGDGRPADTVVLVADGAAIASTPLDVERPDVAAAYEAPNLVKAGFSFNVPARAVDDAGAVRLYAILDGEAVELNFTVAAPWEG